jgi:hypothetical protein
MSDIRTLSMETEGLDTLRQELRYTERRLLARPETVAFAAPFTAMGVRWPAIRDEQLALWDAEDDADVAVSNVDDDADDFVDVISRAMIHHLGGREHPHYKRLFGTRAPSEIQGLGLESQRAQMAEWPSALRAMPAELVPYADQAQAILDQGRTVLDARAAANAARANYRINAIRGFFDEANTLRLSTFAKLLELAATSGRPKTWPKRFFRSLKKAKPATSAA